jgi:hypothetical protein
MQMLQHPSGSLMLTVESLTGVTKAPHTRQYLSSVHNTSRFPCDRGTSYSLLDECNKRTREAHKVSYPSIP